MANIRPTSLTEHDLLAETKRAAAIERRATAELLALLAEVDSRGSYLRLGFSSLFSYCTQALHLSEPAAYGRITAARATRRFPALLSLIDEGALSLTTVGLLSPHLTDENHASLLDSARHRSKREVERLVAAVHPQPDIASSVRALPARPVAAADEAAARHGDAGTLPTDLLPEPPAAVPARRPNVVAPLAPNRYLIRVTVSEETHDKLRRARDLLRHSIPDGDPATIIDRALTVLIQQTQRDKFGAAARPRTSRPRDEQARAESRHVPASVRREVWARDQGRCAFEGSEGRCAEAGGLEFHHIIPFALAGPTTAENLQLRCRAHNAFEANAVFGDWRRRARAAAAAPGGSETQAPSGRS
jgi:hypothetical protein